MVPAAALAAATESWAVIVQRWIDSQLSDSTKAGYREADLFTAWCDGVGLDPRAARRPTSRPSAATPAPSLATLRGPWPAA